MPWWSYRGTDKKVESPGDKHLETLLRTFLFSPMSQEAWQETRGGENAPVNWLRFRQKPMPRDGVFMNGEFHGGAHMNLMMFTDNPRTRRSKEAEARIKQVKQEKMFRKREAQSKSNPWSPFRPRSQSRPRWYESDWGDARHFGGASWSGHQWNNDPWPHHSW